MMAILSFLGGSAFRMIFGEVSAFFTRKQEHAQELERMELQQKLDDAAHSRNIESFRVQAEMGIKVIEAQSEATLAQIEDTAWAQAVSDVGKQTGIKFIDIWNGSIRPLLATVAISTVFFEIYQHGFILTDWDRELFGAILGLYVADRHMSKQGK